MPLRDLSRERVRAFRADMLSKGVRTNNRRRKATPNRANAVMAVLSAFMGYALDDGLIPGEPLPYHHPPVAHRQRPPGVGAADARAPTRPDDRPRRDVPTGPDDLVIPSREGGGPITLRHWRAKMWHPARVDAGLDRMTPYDCRHTFGSLLIHEGREVQRAMRHASATTTLRHYAHQFAEWKGRAKVTLLEAVETARDEVARDNPDAVRRRQAARRIATERRERRERA